MPVPACPRAHLIFVQSRLALRLFKAALDPPAHPRNPHQLGQRRLLRRTGEIERELMRAALLTADQQAGLPPWHWRRTVGQIGPVIQARPLGPVASAEPFPAFG